MDLMNEITRAILLRDLMDSPHGWGRDQGREVFQRLIKKIEANPGTIIFNISLKGVERNDISFASETVVELASRYRGDKGFFLTDLVDDDLVENWDAAAIKKGQPIMVWKGKAAQVIGAQPSQGNVTTFEHVLGKMSATASDIASTLDLQITNASTKLKQLWEQGFLLRRQENAESGGVEFRYFVIG